MLHVLESSNSFPLVENRPLYFHLECPPTPLSIFNCIVAKYLIDFLRRMLLADGIFREVPRMAKYSPPYINLVVYESKNKTLRDQWSHRTAITLLTPVSHRVTRHSYLLVFIFVCFPIYLFPEN